MVNVAAKLTNVANGDQIFVSREVYDLTKDMPLVNFELINFWNMKNVPSGFTMYKVVWQMAPVSKPDISTIVYLRPARVGEHNIPQNRYQVRWDNFIRVKNALLADSLTALETTERLLLHPSQETKKLSDVHKPPVYIVIAKNSGATESRLPIHELMKDPHRLNSGNIYLTR